MLSQGSIDNVPKRWLVATGVWFIGVDGRATARDNFTSSLLTSTNTLSRHLTTSPVSTYLSPHRQIRFHPGILPSSSPCIPAFSSASTRLLGTSSSCALRSISASISSSISAGSEAIPLRWDADPCVRANAEPTGVEEVEASKDSGYGGETTGVKEKVAAILGRAVAFKLNV